MFIFFLATSSLVPSCSVFAEDGRGAEDIQSKYATFNACMPFFAHDEGDFLLWILRVILNLQFLPTNPIIRCTSSIEEKCNAHTMTKIFLHFVGDFGLSTRPEGME
jgi:hypothetical protein